MSNDTSTPLGPDLREGVLLADIPMNGVLAGHVDGESALLARLDDGLHAVGGTCTHYGGPLAEGLVINGEVHCPWHHACFSLRSGHALRAPAFAPLQKWRVEVIGDRVFVREQDSATEPPVQSTGHHPGRIVIVGGGAAGFAAAERLRGLGFPGALSILSADCDLPCDRPNLSKDYLAGTAQEDWIPLQPEQYYAQHRIDLRLDCEVAAIDVEARNVVTASGERVGFDTLLIATGAEPRKLPTAGFDLPNVFQLRSLGDARAIIAACAGATSVAFIGAGFIGLEAAGALRTRGLGVHVVAPEKVPMERVLGEALGEFIVGLHAAHGVVFHLDATATGYDGHVLALQDGSHINADFVVVGAGVTPRTTLAVNAGIAVDDGILVDARLRTSVAGIYAAGDAARYPHRRERVRVEHWVHAQRQGQLAAANMLGADQDFVDVPFFWTHHHGVDLRSNGISRGWDEIRIDGALADHDFIARYYRAGILVSAVSAGRDREQLEIAVQLQAAATT
jgi:NADPH-dependent 2,4-dienoyl-CoA reductase/sulfur reductase-like enzyme/nitrite reductase/ring-hydroxylating ferredoxin subunit